MDHGQEKLAFIRKIHEISSAGLNQNNKIGDVIYELIHKRVSEVEKKILEINSGRTLKDLQHGISQLADQVVTLSLKIEDIEKRLDEVKSSKPSRGKKSFKLKDKEEEN